MLLETNYCIIDSFKYKQILRTSFNEVLYFSSSLSFSFKCKQKNQVSDFIFNNLNIFNVVLEKLEQQLS